MTFEDWFRKVWLEHDETDTRGLSRLHIETGLSPMTLRRALKGTRLRQDTAERLADFTGGKVSKIDLVFAPTRKDAEGAAA